MKKIRVAVLFIVMLLCFGVTALAVPAPVHNRGNTFMGEVLEVRMDGDKTSLLVEGYLKNCDIYKEKLLVNISSDTKVKLACDEEGIKEHKEESKKENKKQGDAVKEEKKQENIAKDVKIEFAKGDTVFMVLDKAMTKSIPPQVNAKFVKVTKAK